MRLRDGATSKAIASAAPSMQPQLTSIVEALGTRLPSVLDGFGTIKGIDFSAIRLALQSCADRKTISPSSRSI